MVIRSTSHESTLFSSERCWLKALPEKFKAKVAEVAKKTKKLGQDDPRRIIHSLKVGLAFTFVSLLYFFRPLYDGFGVSAMWAVLTVVYVFEFTVGTIALAYGFARSLYTLFLIFGITISVLELPHATASTFTRFFPGIKERYDYGVVIFISTFSLVVVSGYRVDKILELGHQRLSTISIGCATCVIVSTFIYPVWSGEELHNLVALNMEKLASFLEGLDGEYFKIIEDGQSVVVSMDDKSFLEGYKSVLDSKTSEESLVPQEFRRKIQELCTKMSSESGKALKALASAVKTMTYPSSSVKSHMADSKTAANDLKTTLKTALLENSDHLEIIPASTVALLLVEIVTYTHKIAESVQELASLTDFKMVDPTVAPENPQLLNRGTVKPISDTDSPHVAVTVCGPSSPALMADHPRSNAAELR
ncbi:hypothetical protein HHK36_019413 [Tetracentron sinense]|uniref:Aluminum-activated malate transporter n=1 Tax=Tetracentron sinense TaxID=13715 RepID=A0A834Z257_TETSI|nr:hypothetical protein HHK36_019413 [Tetracentron sinense]